MTCTILTNLAIGITIEYFSGIFMILYTPKLINVPACIHAMN